MKTSSLDDKTPNIDINYFYCNLTNYYLYDLFSFKHTAPLSPQIIPEDCSAENNSVTVAWQAPNHSFIEGYVLELDDGSGGEFRVSIKYLFIIETYVHRTRLRIRKYTKQHKTFWLGLKGNFNGIK